VVNALAAVTLPDGNTLLAVGQESNYAHILDAGTLQMTGALSGQGRGVSLYTRSSTQTARPGW
jgi:hypothetical protein